MAKIYNMDILKVVYINMITNGEDVIKRVIAIDGDGKAIPPCGACREFLMDVILIGGGTDVKADSYKSNTGKDYMLEIEFSKVRAVL